MIPTYPNLVCYLAPPQDLGHRGPTAALDATAVPQAMWLEGPEG